MVLAPEKTDRAWWVTKEGASTLKKMQRAVMSDEKEVRGKRKILKRRRDEAIAMEKKAHQDKLDSAEGLLESRIKNTDYMSKKRLAEKKLRGIAETVQSNLGDFLEQKSTLDEEIRELDKYEKTCQTRLDNLIVNMKITKKATNIDTITDEEQKKLKKSKRELGMAEKAVTEAKHSLRDTEKEYKRMKQSPSIPDFNKEASHKDWQAGRVRARDRRWWQPARNPSFPWPS